MCCPFVPAHFWPLAFANYHFSPFINLLFSHVLEFNFCIPSNSFSDLLESNCNPWFLAGNCIPSFLRSRFLVWFFHASPFSFQLQLSTCLISGPALVLLLNCIFQTFTLFATFMVVWYHNLAMAWKYSFSIMLQFHSVP